LKKYKQSNISINKQSNNQTIKQSNKHKQIVVALVITFGTALLTFGMQPSYYPIINIWRAGAYVLNGWAFVCSALAIIYSEQFVVIALGKIKKKSMNKHKHEQKLNQNNQKKVLELESFYFQ